MDGDFLAPPPLAYPEDEKMYVRGRERERERNKACMCFCECAEKAREREREASTSFADCLPRALAAGC